MKFLMILMTFTLSTAAFAEALGTCELTYNSKTKVEHHRTFSECAQDAEYLIDLNDRGTLIKKVKFNFRSGMINSSGEIKSVR